MLEDFSSNAQDREARLMHLVRRTAINADGYLRSMSIEQSHLSERAQSSAGVNNLYQSFWTRYLNRSSGMVSLTCRNGIPV
ncbi:hypothetical protein Tco_0456508 [Tanacetum coccineum]